MRDLLSTLMVCAMVFAFGYFAGGRAESEDHEQAEMALQQRVAVLNDLVNKRSKEIKELTNAKTNTIRSTPDTSGCATSYAPTDIRDSVR